MKEKDSTQYDRLFICELILIYIMKIIKYFYLKNTYGTTIDVNSYQINESLLMTGLFDVLLPLIINGTLTELEIKNYCIAYMKIINNKKNRHFPRTAKRPFAKWYLKGYSSSTRMIKIKMNKINMNFITFIVFIIFTLYFFIIMKSKNLYYTILKHNYFYVIQSK